MKKLLILTVAVVLILSLFTGCGDGIWNYFGDSVKTYSTDDLSIQLPGNMMDLMNKNVTEYEMMRANDQAGVLLRREDRENFDEEICFDAESYARFLLESTLETSDEEPELKQSAAGNPVLCYTVTTNDQSFYYYTVILANEEAFFSLQFYCQKENCEELLPRFEAWEATIVMK